MYFLKINYKFNRNIIVITNSVHLFKIIVKIFYRVGLSKSLKKKYGTHWCIYVTQFTFYDPINFKFYHIVSKLCVLLYFLSILLQHILHQCHKLISLSIIYSTTRIYNLMLTC